MKIRSVRANNHRRVFEVKAGDRTWTIPYSMVDTPPSSDDPILDLYVDRELANEGFTYRLRSGVEDSVLMDQVRMVNRDPAYMNGILMHLLTGEVRRRFERSGLSAREVIRRLGTSPAQFYRLMDPARPNKSFGQMFEILYILGCEVEIVARDRGAGSSAGRRSA